MEAERQWKELEQRQKQELAQAEADRLAREAAEAASAAGIYADSVLLQVD